MCGQSYTAVSARSCEVALWLCLTQTIVFNLDVAMCDLLVLFCYKVHVLIYNETPASKRRGDNEKLITGSFLSSPG